MLKKLNKSNKGFTIIEVLIVLAIAALILLIVFLAVPALQRNTRNTTRKQDAGRIAAAVNNYVSNHNGSAPAVSPQGTAAAQATEIINDAGNLGQYPGITPNNPITTAAASKLSVTAGCLGGGAALTTDSIQIVVCGKCNTNSDGSAISGSARDLAVQYVSENNGGTFTGRCQDV